MDPSQGETQGKSLTSKLRTKVKGVKGKVHLPGHKKRQPGDAAGGNDGSSSDYSSDGSPRKPGPETGYNVGDSTPYTTVNRTPLTPEHSPPRDTHNRDYSPSENISSGDRFDRAGQQQYATSTTQGVGGYSERSTATQPAPGLFGQVKQTMGGAAAAVGSKVGYYDEVPAHTQAATSDPNAPTMMQKTKAALGMDKPADPNAPTMVEKTKAALGMDKPTDPNAPTMVEKTKASLGMGPSAPTAAPAVGNQQYPQQQQPGIVNRVSGAVSSMFGSSPTNTGEAAQHTFPAHSDNVTTPGGYGVQGERVTNPSTPNIY